MQSEWHDFTFLKVFAAFDFMLWQGSCSPLMDLVFYVTFCSAFVWDHWKWMLFKFSSPWRLSLSVSHRRRNRVKSRITVTLFWSRSESSMYLKCKSQVLFLLNIQVCVIIHLWPPHTGYYYCILHKLETNLHAFALILYFIFSFLKFCMKFCCCWQHICMSSGEC